jgi:hypothetical protein
MRIGKIRKKSSHGCRVRTTTESTRSYSAIVSAPVCRFAKGQCEQGVFAEEHVISMMTETIEAQLLDPSGGAMLTALARRKQK